MNVERVNDLAEMMDGCAIPVYFAMSDVAVAFGDNKDFQLEAITANQLTEISRGLLFANVDCTEQQYLGPQVEELRKLMPNVEFNNESWAVDMLPEDRVPPNGLLVTSKRDQLDDDRAALNLWLVQEVEINY